MNNTPHLTPSHETRKLCREFVSLHFQGCSTTAFDAAIALREQWGLSIDWHEMSFTLEGLQLAGAATLTGHTNGGACIYYVERNALDVICHYPGR